MMKNIFYTILGTILFVSCAKRPGISDPIPKYEDMRITSSILKEERIINVWTPPNYNNSIINYPVFYMPDGGIKEDFPHIANTLDKLIREKKIPACILVGIENTERRRDLTGESKVKEDEQFNIPMTDGAKDFRAFITDELIPEINSRYRTNDKKGIIGESLAGLFVIETCLLKPETFDFYIAMDPSLWWNGHYLVNNAEHLLNNLPNKQTKLWFAGSSATDINQYTDQLSEILEKKQSQNLQWKYSPEPKEEHHTIFRSTKEKALIWILDVDQ
jgi:predicted alpha/beta superfamily hydrolase